MRTSHLEIRRKILDEKMKITEDELFGSPAFAAYLSDIGESVAKRYGRPFKVKTLWDPQPNADVAWTDNRIVTINTGNHVSLSFPTRETKATSEVGLLAHEVGHINYTDFRALQTYQRALVQGRFYPKKLAGLTPDEENAVEELQQYAADGDTVALKVVLKVAHTLCNLVEDAYIEDRMCRDYPGKLRTGILINRQRMSEQSRSVAEMIDNELGELAILVNLLIQYCFQGNINNADGYKGPLLQVLNVCIGNHFVNVSYMLLAKQPMRVCWMGEQADEPFEPDVDAYANALPEEEFHLYYATAWVSASPRCEIPLGQFSDAMLERAVNLRTTGSYLINRTRRTFIDIAAYISSNLTAGKCYDPLPLLTACGNGRGEDEFLAANCGYELIGTWAFDLLEYSKQRPDSDFLPMTVTFEQSVPAGKLTGKSFVVTGKISGYTRSELEDLIRRAGGQAGGSVTRSTDYLVVADKPGSTKLNAAAKHGTKKINVQQLMDMLNT